MEAWAHDLSPAELEYILHEWSVWARDTQYPFAPEFGREWDDWLTWIYSGGRGAGKALHVGTEIRTGNGWKYMQDVCVGDTVYDECGQPCSVTYKSPVYRNHPCFRIVFDDDMEIIADAEHQWSVNRMGILHTHELHVNDRMHPTLPIQFHEQRVEMQPYRYGRLVMHVPAEIAPGHMPTEYMYNTERVRTEVLMGVDDAGPHPMPTHEFSYDLHEMRASLGCPNGRQIAFIEEVEPQPVQCISVNSPSRLYLVTRSYIPTHNTRAGAELSLILAHTQPGSRGTFVGRTAADVRDIMIQGESGILNSGHPSMRPLYEPSKRQLSFKNGTLVKCFSADEPDQLRGWQSHWAWSEEIAHWRKPQTYSNLLFGLRLGARPKHIVTTTPRPVRLYKDVLARVTTHITTDTSYANRANLSPAYFDTVIKPYEGTRLGRQEILGQLLDDNPRALWKRADIDDTRVSEVPDLDVIAVGVDPMTKDDLSPADYDDSPSATGIVVAGRKGLYESLSSQGYTLDDMTITGTPLEWGMQVVAAYHKYSADVVIAEGNQGGAMVRHTIHTIDPTIPVEIVYAKHGKTVRAGPISSLSQQHRISHVGAFPELEDELCEWVPGLPSPNRLDAYVWVYTHLMLTHGVTLTVVE